MLMQTGRQTGYNPYAQGRTCNCFLCLLQEGSLPLTLLLLRSAWPQHLNKCTQ
jgi:hypothetical protein